MEIKAYKKVEFKEGANGLAFFTVTMYSIHNYLVHLGENKNSLLYRATENVNGEGMSKKDERAFEYMLDKVDEYLIKLSGSEKYKLKVMCGAAVLMLDECIDTLIASQCYEEQTKANKMLKRELEALENWKNQALAMPRLKRRKLLKDVKRFEDKIPSKIKQAKERILKRSSKPYFTLRDLLTENSCESNDCRNLYNYIKNNLYTNEAI